MSLLTFGAAFEVESVSPRDGVNSISVTAKQQDTSPAAVAGGTISFSLPSDSDLSVEPGDVLQMNGYVHKVGNGLVTAVE